MRVILSLVFALAACGVDPVVSQTTSETTAEVQTQPEIQLCGEKCTSAVACGSALCHVCAGMPGTGVGTCLTATPLGMVEIAPGE